MSVTVAATPPLSIIIVNWNTVAVLRECLGSIGRHLGWREHETIVVDNASTDGSQEMVEREFPEVRLVRNRENLGFGRGNNIGMGVARGDFFLLLNSDARLIDDTPRRLVARLRVLPQVGVVGPRLVLGDGRLQPSARRFPSLWRLVLTELGLYAVLSMRRRAELLLGQYWDHTAERSADWLVGACLLLRRQVFEETGGFDPKTFMYGEEIEWCRRIQERNWEIRFTPVGNVVHLDHVSADKLFGADGRIDRCLLAEDRLIARWNGTLAGVLAPPVRVSGALIKILAFSSRRVVHGDDDYGRDVRRAAGKTLSHYYRRLLRRAGKAV